LLRVTKCSLFVFKEQYIESLQTLEGVCFLKFNVDGAKILSLSPSEKDIMQPAFLYFKDLELSKDTCFKKCALVALPLFKSGSLFGTLQFEFKTEDRLALAQLGFAEEFSLRLTHDIFVAKLTALEIEGKQH